MSVLTNEKYICKIWYLSAIEIIDTQVARQGRQYHRNPPPYKNRPTKKNRIYKIKTTPPPPPPNPTQPTPHHTPTQPNPTLPTPNPPPPPSQPNPIQKEKKLQLAKAVKINYKTKISST